MLWGYIAVNLQFSILRWPQKGAEVAKIYFLHSMNIVTYEAKVESSNLLRLHQFLIPACPDRGTYLARDT